MKNNRLSLIFLSLLLLIFTSCLSYPPTSEVKKAKADKIQYETDKLFPPDKTEPFLFNVYADFQIVAIQGTIQVSITDLKTKSIVSATISESEYFVYSIGQTGEIECKVSTTDSNAVFQTVYKGVKNEYSISSSDVSPQILYKKN